MSHEVLRGICVVCNGDIVERYGQVFDPKTGPIIIGPASRQQFKTTSLGLHCSSCGLKYENLPDEKHIPKHLIDDLNDRIEK